MLLQSFAISHEPLAYEPLVSSNTEIPQHSHHTWNTSSQCAVSNAPSNFCCCRILCYNIRTSTGTFPHALLGVIWEWMIVWRLDCRDGTATRWVWLVDLTSWLGSLTRYAGLWSASRQVKSWVSTHQNFLSVLLLFVLFFHTFTNFFKSTHFFISHAFLFYDFILKYCQKSRPHSKHFK